MIVLATDLSSAHGSAAILDNDRTLVSETWSERDVRGQHLFAVLPGMLSRAGLGLPDVELFAVGRGPGSYSGLRVAITAAQSLALPSRQTVHALSSGEAVAVQTGVEGLAAIVGDARRGSAWVGVFRVTGGFPACERPWTLVPIGEVSASLPDGCTAASSQWSRLGPFLEHSDRIRWVEKDVFPSAEVLGRIAMERVRRGVASEPLSPIYMHAAVAG